LQKSKHSCWRNFVSSKKIKICLKIKKNLNLFQKKIQDAIIETVAEKILSQEKSVAVIDSNNKVVGIVKPSKVIHTVFGGRKENS